MIDNDNLGLWVDEDRIVHLRNSERGTHDKCPQRWWWSWRDGLRPKETPKALWFGSAIHEALADYYRPGRKRSKDYIDKFREYADMEGEYIRTNVGSIDEEAWVDARNLGEQMLLNYHKHYEGDRRWDVISTEQTFSIRIPWMRDVRKRLDGPLLDLLNDAPFETDFFILNGTFDGVYIDLDDRKRRKLMEHKTAATISVAHLPMDNQAGSYWMIAQSVGLRDGWLKKGDNIHSITYNFLRKALMDDRPRDAQGYCTNKPGKDHFILAIEAHEGSADIWPVTKTGNVKFPTVAVLEEMAEERGLTVVGDRSKVQPPPLFQRHPVRRTPQQRRSQLARLQDEVTKMSMEVLGAIPLTKSSGRDTCPMCPFREMCELHESGADWQGFRDALFRVEDLYVDHIPQKSA